MSCIFTRSWSCIRRILLSLCGVCLLRRSLEMFVAALRYPSRFLALSLKPLFDILSTSPFTAPSFAQVTSPSLSLQCTSLHYIFVGHTPLSDEQLMLVGRCSHSSDGIQPGGNWRKRTHQVRRICTRAHLSFRSLSQPWWPCEHPYNFFWVAFSRLR